MREVEALEYRVGAFLRTAHGALARHGQLHWAQFQRCFPHAHRVAVAVLRCEHRDWRAAEGGITTNDLPMSASGLRANNSRTPLW